MGWHHEIEHNESRERFSGGGGFLGAALALDAIATTGMLYQNYEMGNQQCASMGFPSNPLNCPEYPPTAYAAPPEQYNAMPPQEQYTAMPPPEQYSAYGADGYYSSQYPNSLEMSAAPYPETTSSRPETDCASETALDPLGPESSQSNGPPFANVDLGPDPDNSADRLNAAELAYLQTQSRV